MITSNRNAKYSPLFMKLFNLTIRFEMDSRRVIDLYWKDDSIFLGALILEDKVTRWHFIRHTKTAYKRYYFIPPCVSTQPYGGYDND